MDDLLLFTAKWDESGGSHPLAYHLMDSGAVAAALWSGGLTEGSRQEIAGWLNLDQPDAGRLIAFWASLHDLGKAAPSFQTRCEPARQALRAVGFTFPPIVGASIRHHSLLSAWILEDHLADLNLAPVSAARNLLLAIAGHHGVFPSFAQFNESTYRQDNLGDERWSHNQKALFGIMSENFDPPRAANLARGKAATNAFFDVLTGLFITSDWIASNTDLFPYHAPDLSPQTYYQEVAKGLAEKALKRVGWLGWQPDGAPRAFQEVFSETPTPNSIQQAVFAQFDSLRDPFLMILEAPTGSGKTETALYTADYWIQQKHLRGCYVAMPSQATSNQMFDRVKKYLEPRFQGQEINLQLAHGNALLMEEYQNMQLAAIADDDGEATGGVNAMSWFTPRKLTLLAPFGVGTVDQTFLSVLQSRHFALRLFGLFRKVVIFDEVHAYDVYMVEIFKRLLAWLRAIGTSVIILSATLPKNTRMELLEAYNPLAEIETRDAIFPRLSLNSNQIICTIPLGNVANRQVQLEPIDHRPESILVVLNDKLASGGCAAVICNTVGRAQQIYRAICNSRNFNPDYVMLFHSRFPFCWREQREKKVLAAFGRLGQSATDIRREIVVATQVIEQSLDLDFDLLITDLAPLDLLIQRIGRLQRHSDMAYPPLRPPKLAVPTCVVAFPDQETEKLACFGNDTYIYDEVFLQRSYFVLREKTMLSLPEDSDQLIEAVYSEDDLPGLTPSQQEELHVLYTKMLHKAADKSVGAQNRLIADVDYAEVLGAGQVNYAEDDPTAHRDLQAMTRDTRPSVEVVCLERDPQGSLFLLDGHTPFDLSKPPVGETLKKALRSMVTISNWQVVDYFRRQPLYAAWKKSAHLRYVYPAVFEAGTCPLKDGLTLYLDEELGLRVEKEAKLN